MWKGGSGGPLGPVRPTVGTRQVKQSCFVSHGDQEDPYLRHRTNLGLSSSNVLIHSNSYTLGRNDKGVAGVPLGRPTLTLFFLRPICPPSAATHLPFACHRGRKFILTRSGLVSTRFELYSEKRRREFLTTEKVVKVVNDPLVVRRLTAIVLVPVSRRSDVAHTIQGEERHLYESVYKVGTGSSEYQHPSPVPVDYDIVVSARAFRYSSPSTS